MKQLAQRAGQWPRLKAERAKLEQQADLIQRSADEHEQAARIIETAMQVRETWLSLRQLEDELQVMGGTTDTGIPDWSLGVQ